MPGVGLGSVLVDVDGDELSPVGGALSGPAQSLAPPERQRSTSWVRLLSEARGCESS